MDATAFDLNLLEWLPQLVYWKDSALRYQGCNRAFAELAALDNPSDIRGRTDAELPWAGPQAATLAAQDRLALNLGSSNPTETELTVNGRTVMLLMERRRLGDVLVAIGTEVTAYKEAEAQWRRERDHALSLLMLSRQLERTYSFDGVLEAVRNEVEAILGYHSVWAYISNGDGSAMLLSIAGSRGALVRTEISRLQTTGDAYLEEIMRGDHIAVVHDARIDPRTDKNIVGRLGNVSIINVPMWLTGERLGSLGTGSFGNEGVRVPDQDGLDYLKAVANHTAAAIDRITLYRERKA